MLARFRRFVVKDQLGQPRPLRGGEGNGSLFLVERRTTLVDRPLTTPSLSKLVMSELQGRVDFGCQMSALETRGDLASLRCLSNTFIIYSPIDVRAMNRQSSTRLLKGRRELSLKRPFD